MFTENWARWGVGILSVQADQSHVVAAAVHVLRGDRDGHGNRTRALGRTEGNR
jgi:hypothetical protein